MLDFESDTKYLKVKYLAIERHILQIQDIHLQYFNFKSLSTLFPLLFYKTFKI